MSVFEKGGKQEGWKNRRVGYLPNFHTSNAYEEQNRQFDIQTCVKQ
jgi:hypothetical protein